MSRRAQNSQKVQCIALGFDQKTSKATPEIFELSLPTFWHMDVAADMTNTTILVLSLLLVAKLSKRTLLFMVFYLFGKPQRCITAPAILGFLSSTSLSPSAHSYAITSDRPLCFLSWYAHVNAYLLKVNIMLKRP